MREQRWFQPGGVREGFLEEVTYKLDERVEEGEHVLGRRNSMNKSQEGGGVMEGPGKCGGLHPPGGEAWVSRKKRIAEGVSLLLFTLVAGVWGSWSREISV